jgi:methylmalonyl-CoA mutase C-terminal domain/subunit
MASAKTQERKIRVLIAKPGLDGHDRGAKVVARALRDEGMEVIYTGLRQSPERIAEAAIQEDVDVVGLSCLSGAHMTLFPRVVELLEASGAGDIVVLGGGIIPEQDMRELEKAGIYRCFGPGTSTEHIVRFVEDAVAERTKRQKESTGRPKKAKTVKRRPSSGSRSSAKSTKSARSKASPKRKRGGSHRSRGRRS